MAKADSRSITPPPGWRYIVLPALPPVEPPPPKPPRPRLADNVVAMFTDERAPVLNPKRRGRLPRVVTALRRWDRIHPGDYCLIWASATSSRLNHGRMVKVVGRVDAVRNTWRVQVVGGFLTTFDPDAPDDVASHSQRSTATVEADRLRRCAGPARS